MPLKIIRTPDDPEHSRAVIYVPDTVDQHRTDRPRPQGRMYRDPITGQLALRSPVRPERPMFVGLDLGQSNDFTALAVVERTAAGLVVPMLSRTRNRPYTDIVASVADLMARPELVGAKLIVDATGVGRPVLDLFRATGLDPYAITITGGSKVTGGRRRLYVPKRDLINAVLLALQSGTLLIAPSVEYAGDLRTELADMRARISRAGNDQYGARDGSHDDLVLALALAVWIAERVGRSGL